MVVEILVVIFAQKLFNKFQMNIVSTKPNSPEKL